LKYIFQKDYTVAYKTRYTIKNPTKYIGDPTNIICRSLWERRVCKYLDENKSVSRWGSEELAIPYYSPVDRKMHRYFPDFIAEIMNKNGSVKTYIVEVKPKKQTEPPKKPKRKRKSYIQESLTYIVNTEKWKAAEEYCKKNGWEFIILTEDDILP
tara:strand:+ start:1556 stop:2020 length:465 start_codon:yes stop_codon:yes gene_type:complete